jgi:membrane-associated phospholipid phosphatase
MEMMREKQNIFLNLKAFDLVVVIFYTFLTLLNIIYSHLIELWLFFVLMNVTVIAIAFTVAYMEERYKSKLWRTVHYWYIVPIVLLTFKELYYLVYPIRGRDYDDLFIAIDRWMFGTDPTHFLAQFSHPVLTEILQIIYGLFYFLPLILAIFLMKNRRFLASDFVIFSVVYGFFLSYLGYFTLPAIGPRFTLHNFHTINDDLPGLWLTNFLRDMINTGESIPPGTPNPEVVVQRDVFPSGHTMITLVVMYLSVKLRSRTRYFLIPIGAALIFSTVYLWYHYVIDLIAGLIFMIFSLWSGYYFFNWWRRKKGLEEFDYSRH